MMADGSEGGGLHLAEILKHPEDLDKIAFLKSEFGRKKAAVDSQLKAGLQEQLEQTQSGMSALMDGQQTVSQIKEELMKIDKLCAESQTMIQDFPNINLVSQVHRNFSQVELMKANIEGFGARLDDLRRLLHEDEDDIDNQPNLLPAHYELSQLRDIQDEAMEQIQHATDQSLETTLQQTFEPLEEVIALFDQHVETACQRLINLVNADNTSMVVRLAVVIDEEDKADRRAEALQNAQRDFKDIASRFKSIKNNARQVRGYKARFLQSIEERARERFSKININAMQQSKELDKQTKWFFNDLFTVKKGMVQLMPKKWKIYRTYTQIYHKLMHDCLVACIDDPDTETLHYLIIIDWIEVYYQKMAKLGWKADDLPVHVLDGRETELIKEYRQRIVRKVDEWMDKLTAGDGKAFTSRDPEMLDVSVDGQFRTKTLGDMWQMLHQQLDVAQQSGREDVVEGVVEAMFTAMKSRQVQWQKTIDEDVARYKAPNADHEGLHLLQDWLLAIANDQIACIEDNEDQGQVSFLTRFQMSLEKAVSAEYMDSRAMPELEVLRDGFVDLGNYCLTTFVSLIFSIDFRPVLPEFFTAKWYTEPGIKLIINTFEDYLTDYRAVLNPILLDVFVEELADEMLVRYLLSVRNRNAKFRRADPYQEKLRDDVLALFDWFNKSPIADTLKAKWRVVDYLTRMIVADKADVADVYESFKHDYWDLQMPWVESALKTRDDYDRAMMNAVKAKASEMYTDRGPETIMSKVK